jgi:hypothetical protein
MPTETISDPPLRISPRKLWFGATAAAVAWALEGTVSAIISSKACQNNIGSWGPLSPSGVRLVLAAVTLIGLGFAIAGGLISFRNWRRLAGRPEILHAEGRRRDQFMALVGTFASLVFVIGILWAGIPLIMLDICVKAR